MSANIMDDAIAALSGPETRVPVEVAAADAALPVAPSSNASSPTASAKGKREKGTPREGHPKEAKLAEMNRTASAITKYVVKFVKAALTNADTEDGSAYSTQKALTTALTNLTEEVSTESGELQQMITAHDASTAALAAHVARVKLPEAAKALLSCYEISAKNGWQVPLKVDGYEHAVAQVLTNRYNELFKPVDAVAVDDAEQEVEQDEVEQEQKGPKTKKRAIKRRRT